MEEVSWTILTFETNSGEKPVDEFIKRQQPQARSKKNYLFTSWLQKTETTNPAKRS